MTETRREREEERERKREKDREKKRGEERDRKLTNVQFTWQEGLGGFKILSYTV